MEGGLEVWWYVVENEAKCCWSASRIKGLKKGAGRGITISVKLVRCKSRERLAELDDRLDEEATNSSESAL